jgi:hypothetical protein
VAPHRAQIGRRYRHHEEAGLIEADRGGAEPPQFFYLGPVDANPLAHPWSCVWPRLRPLRAEAAWAKQAPDVIGMVDDGEMLRDQVDDPAARPQVRAIPGRFRPAITRPVSRCRCAGVSWAGVPMRARSPARPCRQWARFHRRMERRSTPSRSATA